MTSTTNLSTGLTAGHRERLMRVAREVSFDMGTRIFEEGRRADRFWIVRTGTVASTCVSPVGGRLSWSPWGTGS